MHLLSFKNLFFDRTLNPCNLVLMDQMAAEQINTDMILLVVHSDLRHFGLRQ